MERGGIHGYRKIPNTSSGTKLSDINGMRLQSNEINNQNNNQSEADNECTVREQDRFMPIANVIRIMRKILPPHAKISDDAKETIQECVSEYISFITGEANERCQREQRKTITAEDVLWAMSKLGFDDYVEPLTLYLHRYRDAEGDRSSFSASASASASPIIRGTPALDAAASFMKRPLDYGAAFGVTAATTTSFHVGHAHHHNGFYGYYKDVVANSSTGNNNNNAGGGSSQAAVLNGDHHLHNVGQYK